MKNRLKLKEPVAFLFIKLGNRYLGPHCDNLCDIVLAYAALADTGFFLTLFDSLLILFDELVLL